MVLAKINPLSVSNNVTMIALNVTQLEAVFNVYLVSTLLLKPAKIVTIQSVLLVIYNQAL